MSLNENEKNFESISESINSFLESCPLNQQKMYCLIHLNCSSMGYIQRFIHSLNVTNFYPKYKIVNSEEQYFNESHYELTLDLFLKHLSIIFKELGEFRKHQYVIFINNEISILSQIMNIWNSNVGHSAIPVPKYTKDSEDKDEVLREYILPTTSIISKYITDDFPYLFLFKMVYSQINNLLKSLKFNQQAFFVLLYLIHAIDRFLSQANLSLNVPIDFLPSVAFYEEFYDKNLYSQTLQLFYNSLAKVYFDISNNNVADPMNSLIALNSFVTSEVSKISEITKNWSFLHIIYPDWNIKQIYG